MHALTVCQPWAWGIIHGPKRVENRSWYTAYRGIILIHAGKSRNWLCSTLNDGTQVPADLTFGAIIGAARLTACLHIDKPLPKDVTAKVREAMRSPFAEGPWCWVFDRVWPLTTPVSCTGLLGLWTAPDTIARQCLNQISDIEEGQS